MTAAAELVARLRARGVTLEADPPDLVVRPADALTADEVEALRRHKQEILAALRRPWVDPAPAPSEAIPVSAVIAGYRQVLGRLWLLNTQPASGAVDATEARTLLAELTRLVDELGPAFATAVSRAHARAWAKMMNRCPWCGEAGRFHDPATGQELAL